MISSPLSSRLSYAPEISSPIILNLWVRDSNKQVELYFNQVLLRFSNHYPHIQIHLEMIKGDDLKASHYISTARLNQNIPDLIASSLKVYNQLATEHFLYPLDSFIAQYPENHFLDTSIISGIYNNQTYGIAYALNPEVLVYRKDFLDSLHIPYPENLNTMATLETYIQSINALYSADQLDKVAFAIPTLTSDGHFISSLLHTTHPTSTPSNTFETLYTMYNQFDISPYHYAKIETHPFFSGKAALAIEPLSLIYSAIEKDNNLLKKIGIMQLPKNGLQFAYSQHKYLSICKDTSFPEEAQLFLNFFFSSSEVYERYKALNLPIVLESLMPIYTQDSRFDNHFIVDYVRAAFHYNISPTLNDTLLTLDKYYDTRLHKDYLYLD